MSRRFSDRDWMPVHHDAATLPDLLNRLTVEPDDVAIGQDDAWLSVPAIDQDVYIPEPYEPNYAYPLIVWLRGPDDHLANVDLPTLMTGISERNYFGSSVVVDPSMNEETIEATDAGSEPLTALESQLWECVGDLRRAFHIHTERVYVAGFGQAGSHALRLLLNRPDWLCGAIAIGGSIPEMDTPFSRYRHLRGRRVYLAGGFHDSQPLAETMRSGRLLHATGMDVRLRIYSRCRHSNSHLLRDMDQWLMSGISSCYV